MSDSYEPRRNPHKVAQNRSFFQAFRNIYLNIPQAICPGNDPPVQPSLYALGRHYLADAESREQAEKPEVQKDQEEVIPGPVQQVSRKRRSKWPGDEAIGGKGEAEDGPEVIQAEAVCHQWSRDGK